MNDVPIVGKKYYFFDDGKTSPSRCYVAVVREVLTKKQAKTRDLYYYNSRTIMTLYDIWRKEVDEHRQEENFKVFTKDTTIGAPWLYAEDTDYFVACVIPDYDNNRIWFVRDIYGDWFSLDVQSSWQSGRLDITGEIYENAKNEFDLNNYDGCYDSYLNDIIEND